MTILEQLEAAYEVAVGGLESAETTDQTTEWYRETLGKKGSIQLMSRQFGKLSSEEKPLFGKRLNEIKNELEAKLQERQDTLKRAEIDAKIASDAIDVTLPGRPQPIGRLHPSTMVLRDVLRIFGDMGFQVFRSEDVVTDQLNFEDLNMPPEHPARDMQDTFYTEDEGVLLRTHTSGGQILAMRKFHPEPIRVVLPGMCYRNEQITVRSEIQFHQVEGLVVGEAISLADLKGTLTEFAKRLFGRSVRTRFRASYFPFTEPSAEMDVYLGTDTERDRRITKGTGWLEILGCGMVHPTVLRNGGYDPDHYTGFAFGMGIERMVMNKYGIPDIRYFWSNDLRFLEQF